MLLVVPLVERLGFVEALVALEPDEPGAGAGGDGLGQLGLADAGGAFHEDGFLQPVGQEHDPGSGRVGQVVDAPERFLNGVDGLEALHRAGSAFRGCGPVGLGLREDTNPGSDRLPIRRTCRW